MVLKPTLTCCFPPALLAMVLRRILMSSRRRGVKNPAAFPFNAARPPQDRQASPSQRAMPGLEALQSITPLVATSAATGALVLKSLATAMAQVRAHLFTVGGAPGVPEAEAIALLPPSHSRDMRGLEQAPGRPRM